MNGYWLDCFSMNERAWSLFLLAWSVNCLLLSSMHLHVTDSEFHGGTDWQIRPILVAETCGFPFSLSVSISILPNWYVKHIYHFIVPNPMFSDSVPIQISLAARVHPLRYHVHIQIHYKRMFDVTGEEGFRYHFQVP